MEHKELMDYLMIAKPKDLYKLAFNYAVVERWELLALVVIELVKRADQDRAITNSYMEKHYVNNDDTKGI